MTNEQQAWFDEVASRIEDFKGKAMSWLHDATCNCVERCLEVSREEAEILIRQYCEGKQ